MSTTIYGQKFDSRTLAVTLTRYNGTVYQEADVIFNTSGKQFDSFYAAGGKGTDMHRVALHELGHVLGLDHPDEHGQPNGQAIMDATVSHTDHLLADDITGAQSLYGAAPNAPADSIGNGHLANISQNLFTGVSNAFADGHGNGVDMRDGSVKPLPDLAREYKQAGIAWPQFRTGQEVADLIAYLNSLQ